MALLLARRGVPCSRSKIAALEAGGRPHLSFMDVLVLAHALGVAVSDLLEGHEEVVLAGGLSLTRGQVRELLGLNLKHAGSVVPENTPVRTSLTASAPTPVVAAASRIQTAEVDAALARKLGVSAELVVKNALARWGRTMTEERDHRSNQLGTMQHRQRAAHRGHITRQLTREINADLTAQGLDQRKPT